MRAMEADGGPRQVELPKPQPEKDRLLVRVAAAGVTPVEYTILSSGHPRAKAPLVLGNEGGGVIEDAGGSSAQADDARQAGAEPLNGNGFYRWLTWWLAWWVAWWLAWWVAGRLAGGLVTGQ
jgi:NADPH2:quinone reductase